MNTLLSLIRNRSIAPASFPLPFLRLLGGLAISRVGDAIYSLALPWLAYELTESVVVMGSLFATGVLPVVLLGPFAGVYVDRFDRAKVMMWSDLIRAAIVGLLPLLHLAGALQVWHLYAASFLLALFTLLFDVSLTATVPSLAGERLTEANAAIQTVGQIGDMAGPALAGLVIAGVGSLNALWLDALSFGATFLAVRQIGSLPSGRPPGHGGSIFKGMAEGLRWLIQSPTNLALSLQAMVGNFGYSAVAAVLTFYLRSELGLSAELSGINFAVMGAGGLVGSLGVVPLNRRFARGQLFPALLLFGTFGFVLSAFWDFWLAPGVGLAIVGCCNVAWSILSASVRQETVPSHMLGRVLSFSRVLTRAAMPVGAWIGSTVGDRFDPVYVFVLAAAAKGVEVVIALVSPVRKA